MKSVRVIALTAASVGLFYAIGCQPTTPTASNPTATPTPSSSNNTTTDNGYLKVPASHKYYAQADTTCVSCHTNLDPTTGNAVRFMPFPDGHEKKSPTNCVSCHQTAAETAPPVVNMTVAKVTTGPDNDPATNDTLWAGATEAAIPVQGGVNKSETTIKMKAVHDGTYVYFRATLDDPTKSLERQPYVKNADGTWTKTKAWPDKYEDKLAFIWDNPEKPMTGFSTQGCAVTCHSAGPSDKYGRPVKYAPAAGQFGDMWHAKTARHAAVPELKQIDDQSVWYPDDLSNPLSTTDTLKDGGRKGDAQLSTSTKGDYTTNDKDSGGLPKWMPAGDDTKLKAGVGSNPFWMLATQSFNPDKFAVGDKLASHLAKRLEGSRGDIDGYAVWSGGVWTYEFKRKLDTGDTSGRDTKFLPGQTYTMGAAYFDNNQIGHAVQFGVTKVTFAQ